VAGTPARSRPLAGRAKVGRRTGAGEDQVPVVMTGGFGRTSEDPDQTGWDVWADGHGPAKAAIGVVPTRPGWSRAASRRRGRKDWEVRRTAA